jgi:hypothetical protein
MDSGGNTWVLLEHDPDTPYQSRLLRTQSNAPLSQRQRWNKCDRSFGDGRARKVAACEIAHCSLPECAIQLVERIIV